MFGGTRAWAADAHAARIGQIENGLRPGVVIRGQEPAPVTFEARMAHYKVPGVSIAVFDGDRILWTRQYGVVDATTREPVTADTLFQASSVSKLVTAVAALRLVRDGSLTLDGDVNDRLKTWKVPDNQFTRTGEVTLRRLLSHSAGATVHGFAGYAPGEPLPTTRQILEGVAPANSPPVTVDAPPGSAWRYSGGGYVIVQQLMEDATGEPLARTMQRLVLDPAGMSRSTYAQPLPEPRRAEAASGHAADGAPLPGGGMVFPEAAPAGLWSTPSDLARLAIELNAELDGRSDRILDQSLARQMMTRQSGTWGLGVSLGGEGAEPRFSHVGTNPGFQAYLIFLPQRRQGVVVMTNGANQSGFFQEIVMAVAKAYGWPGFEPIVKETVAVDPAVLKGYAGSWLADGAPAFEVIGDGGRLFAQGGPFGPLPVELHALSPTRFFILSTGFEFDFSGAAEGKAVLGGSIRAVRLAQK